MATTTTSRLDTRTTLTPNMINRIGFIILGLTNNFAYVIMLSAAYDLLKQNDPDDDDTFLVNPLMKAAKTTTTTTTSKPSLIFSNTTDDEAILQLPVSDAIPGGKPFCNEHSTSTVLLADSLPSLTTKLIYPFLLVGLPTSSKAIATALLSAASFLITGLASSKLLIFAGVACASFSCGLGETTYLSNSPRYGDVAISGWSIGTGASGLLGAMAYALLRMVLSITAIMSIMLVAPLLMLLAYFVIIKPIETTTFDPKINYQPNEHKRPSISISVVSSSSDEDQNKPFICQLDTTTGNKSPIRIYGSYGQTDEQQQQQTNKQTCQFNYKEKLRFLPRLTKYFLPLFLVYYAEFFINQGLHELIYYPEVGFLDHAAQYRWFQVTYQLGVMISRSSLDFFVIKYLWTMSLLQLLNALLFFAHTAKWIYIPNFYATLAIIIYEGLLGGFTYANTFFCLKRDLPRNRQEFGISTVVIADTLGIVLAGATAIPIHDSLCKLYT